MDAPTCNILCGRRLVFGDIEQIKALKEIEERENILEFEKSLPLWKVTCRLDSTFQLRAKDENDAEEKALEIFEGAMDSHDVEFHVRKIKEAP